ncbi:MAG: hypothetical protein IJS13_07950 [Paludibacteraceae bacterium]|nr:hypothetical protein [Paludibacteraceae bacterium]
MNKILLMAIATLLSISAFAQESVKKVRVYEGNKVVYEQDYDKVDSVVFVTDNQGETELTGNYLKVGDKITTLGSALYDITYGYYTNPTFQSETVLRIYDTNGNQVFWIVIYSLSMITELNTGTYTYSVSRSYSTNNYWVWGCTGVASSAERAVDSFVVSKKGNFYVIDCVFNANDKLHYEGIVAVQKK